MLKCNYVPMICMLLKTTTNIWHIYLFIQNNLMNMIMLYSGIFLGQMLFKLMLQVYYIVCHSLLSSHFSLLFSFLYTLALIWKKLYATVDLCNFPPACEQNVLQHHVTQTPKNIVFKGMFCFSLIFLIYKYPPSFYGTGSRVW